VDTDKATLDQISSGALYKRLTAYAFSLARDMPAVFDGISPDDLVGETLLEYWTSEKNLNWDAGKGSLERFLCGVLKNKFLMHARRSRYCAGPRDDDGPLRVIPTRTASDGFPRARTDLIRTVAQGDRELEELVKAAEDLDSDGRTNQQLSQLLDTTTADVVNRKKRLTRRLDRAERSAEGRNLHRKRTKF
jgi:DNA-directed RNA polymerase specialized sigma24 family protein